MGRRIAIFACVTGVLAVAQAGDAGAMDAPRRINKTVKRGESVLVSRNAIVSYQFCTAQGAPAVSVTERPTLGALETKEEPMVVDDKTRHNGGCVGLKAMSAAIYYKAGPTPGVDKFKYFYVIGHGWYPYEGTVTVK